MTPENGALFDFTSIYLMLPGRFVHARRTPTAFAPAQLARQDHRRAPRLSARDVRHAAICPMRKLKPNSTPSSLALEAVRDKRGRRLSSAMRCAPRSGSTTNPDCCAFAGEPYFRPDLFGDGLVRRAAGRPRRGARRPSTTASSGLKRSGVLD